MFAKYPHFKKVVSIYLVKNSVEPNCWMQDNQEYISKSEKGGTQNLMKLEHHYVWKDFFTMLDTRQDKIKKVKTL